VADDFKFSISAQDRYTPAFKDVGGKAEKSAERIVKAFGGAAKAANELRDASLHIGESLGITGLGLGSLLRAGGPIAALGAAAAGLAVIGNRAGMAGFTVDRMSRNLGMSTTDIQRFRGAAKLAGIEIATMDAAIENVGRTIQDAKFGRNPLAANLMQLYGIDNLSQRVQVNRAGALRDLARALSGINDPNAQRTLAEQFGVTDILPMLRQGEQALRKLGDEAERLGEVQSPEAIARSKQYADQLFATQTAFDGLMQTIGVRVLPTLTTAIRNLQSVVENPGAATASFLRGEYHMEAYRQMLGLSKPGHVYQTDESSWNGMSGAV
jgi:hypothetical protein